MSGDYQLVPLRSGAQTLFSASYGEKMHPGLGPAAEAELLRQRWPGNVRQLENVIFRAVTLSDQPVLEPTDLVQAGNAADVDAALEDVREFDPGVRDELVGQAFHDHRPLAQTSPLGLCCLRCRPPGHRLAHRRIQPASSLPCRS